MTSQVSAGCSSICRTLNLFPIELVGMCFYLEVISHYGGVESRVPGENQPCKQVSRIECPETGSEPINPAHAPTPQTCFETFRRNENIFLSVPKLFNFTWTQVGRDAENRIRSRGVVAALCYTWGEKE